MNQQAAANWRYTRWLATLTLGPYTGDVPGATLVLAA